MEKKKLKRLLMAVFAAAFITLTLPGTIHAAAEVKFNVYENANGEDMTLDRMIVQTNELAHFDVQIGGSTAEVKDVKVNKPKFMDVSVTESASLNIGGVEEASFSMYRITLYPTKKGDYKVTFTVEGKKYTMKVRVVDTYTYYKNVKFGSQLVYAFKRTASNGSYTTQTRYKYNVKGKSGKFKIENNKDIKQTVTGLIVATTNKKGKLVLKKYKNGGNIKLSEAVHTSTSDDGLVITRDNAKYTYIFVSQKNGYTGYEYIYTIDKNEAGQNAIKYVLKHPDGTLSKPVYYTTYDEIKDHYGFRLWQE